MTRLLSFSPLFTVAGVVALAIAGLWGAPLGGILAACVAFVVLGLVVAHIDERQRKRTEPSLFVKAIGNNINLATPERRKREWWRRK